MTIVSEPKTNEGTTACALERITDSAEVLRLAKERKSPPAVSAAQYDLDRVVLVAIDLGVSWQNIGDVLGINRGAAYQRFRRRSGSSVSATRAAMARSVPLAKPTKPRGLN
jgi:hypothetical protein